MSEQDDFKQQFLRAIGQDPNKEVKKAELNKNVVDGATKIAQEELQTMRNEYIKFQEATKHLVVFNQLKPAIHMLADAMKGLYELITDTIEVDKLSQQGKEEYLRAQRTRAAILARIHQHYQKEDE